MSKTPEVGDRVRLSYEGVYGGDFGPYPSVTLPSGRRVAQLDGEGLVEILERANSPRRDPVGTVRSFGEDAIVVWVKTDGGCWWRTPGQGSTKPKPDAGMIGSEVIGAVPGTPAAVAEAAKAAPIEPEYEYYRGNLYPSVYRVRVRGTSVEVFGDQQWSLLDHVTADDVRTSGRWSKFNGKPSDAD